MINRMRSPFGAILREERREKGISRTDLAHLIADRFATDPTTAAEFGMISDRTIAKIESPRASAAEFVHPQPETVRGLMLALGIEPDTDRGKAMLRAANASLRREEPVVQIPEDLYQIPFVRGGRESQWDALHRAWNIARSGQPQIRLIEGTAGVGKTRLVQEFCNSLQQSDPSIVLALGECSSGAATVEPYLPWRRANSYVLRTGISSATRTRLDDYYASVLLGSLGKLGGVIIDVQDMQDWLTSRAPDRLVEFKRIGESFTPTNTLGRFDQFMTLITSIASVVPLVVVLEDLHWADESSCSLLLHLQRQMRLHTDLPLMVIGTYRSSDLALPGERHPLLHVINEMGRQLDNVVLSLKTTVDDDTSLQFVAGIVDAFPMAADNRDLLIFLLHHRTGGHPLFTTEFVQRLVETNALILQSDRTWTLDREKVITELPGRMRAIIRERVERLSSEARTIVEIASVQGSPFSIDVIPMITGLSDSNVAMIIDRELVELHRIFRVSDEQHGMMYEFDHEVVAETVYESLSPHRRQSLHRSTAEAMLAVFEHDNLLVAPKVAHHFEQGNMMAEAAAQALITSSATFTKMDHDLTLVWVERSERLAQAANEDGSLWRARLRRAHVLREMGTLLEAGSIAYDAIAHAQRVEDVELEADAFEVLALVAYDQGELDDAADAWTHGNQLYERIGRKDRVSIGQSMLSHVACRTGRLDMAIRHARSAWASAPDATRDEMGAEALLAEGNAMMELGRPKDAIDLHSRSFNTFTYLGEIRGIFLCRMNIALCHTRLGFLEHANADFDALQKELQELNTPRLLAFVCLYHGMTQEAADDFESAQEHYQQALITRQEAGLTAMSGDALAGLLRAAIGLKKDVELHLEALQEWWRTNDPAAVENPLLAMHSLVQAYELLGNERLMNITLDESARFFLERANQIQNPAIREMYLRGNSSGKALLARAKEAGLV